MAESADVTTITPLTRDQLEQLSKLFDGASAIAIDRIRELAGADFLEQLLADPGGDIVVQIALKGGLTRVNVAWPKFSNKIETVAELVSGRGRVRTQ